MKEGGHSRVAGQSGQLHYTAADLPLMRRVFAQDLWLVLKERARPSLARVRVWMRARALMRCQEKLLQKGLAVPESSPSDGESPGTKPQRQHPQQRIDEMSRKQASQ